MCHIVEAMEAGDILHLDIILLCDCGPYHFTVYQFGSNLPFDNGYFPPFLEREGSTSSISTGIRARNRTRQRLPNRWSTGSFACAAPSSSERLAFASLVRISLHAST